jgi:uncharacterized Zn finger protein
MELIAHTTIEAEIMGNYEFKVEINKDNDTSYYVEIVNDKETRIEHQSKYYSLFFYRESIKATKQFMRNKEFIYKVETLLDPNEKRPPIQSKFD